MSELIIAKQNCWDFSKCGREPNNSNAKEHGACPIPTFQQADKFNEGKNGGRACAYLTRLLGYDCPVVRELSLHDLLSKKKHKCEKCDFHKTLKNEHGEESSMSAFKEFLVYDLK